MDKYGFAQGMVDIFSYKPTVYAVVAGFWASEKDWPTDTRNLHHNVVVAGGKSRGGGGDRPPGHLGPIPTMRPRCTSPAPRASEAGRKRTSS